MAVVDGLDDDTPDDRDSRWSTPMTIRAGNTVLPLDDHALHDSVSTVGAACLIVNERASSRSPTESSS